MYCNNRRRFSDWFWLMSCSVYLTDPAKYNTFLQSRPEAMENQAIELVIKLCTEYRSVLYLLQVLFFHTWYIEQIYQSMCEFKPLWHKKAALSCALCAFKTNQNFGFINPFENVNCSTWKPVFISSLSSLWDICTLYIEWWSSAIGGNMVKWKIM